MHKRNNLENLPTAERMRPRNRGNHGCRWTTRPTYAERSGR